MGTNSYDIRTNFFLRKRSYDEARQMLKPKYIIDMAYGNSLGAHVMQAYYFLCDNYEPGDRIFIFGFSRGAFEARYLIGLLNVVGLVLKGMRDIASQAWDIFHGWDLQGQPLDDKTSTLVSQFRSSFCHRAFAIFYAGLFDTVAAVGATPIIFRNVTYCDNVVHVRHALSLDERRVKFEQELIVVHSHHQFPPEYQDSKNSALRSRSLKQRNVAEWIHQDINQNIPLLMPKAPRSSRQPFVSKPSFEEVWFAGDHEDIGGGWFRNSKGSLWSVYPLRWLVSSSLACGMLYNKQVFAKIKTDNMDAPLHDAMYIGDSTNDTNYGRGNTTLMAALTWRAMELLPLARPIRASRNNNTKDYTKSWSWSITSKPHMFAIREIPHTEYPTRIHWTVKERAKQGYSPRPKLPASMVYVGMEEEKALIKWLES